MTIDPIATQALAGVLAVNLIERMKRSENLPLLKNATGLAKRLASIFTAIITVTGVTVAWSGTWQTGGTLTVVIPPLESILNFLMNVAVQHYGQKAYYALVVLAATQKKAGA